MGDDSFKRFFNEVLSNLKAHMKDGIPALGIPPLDPLNVGSFSFKEDSSLMKFKARFQGIVITGLSTITFPKLEFEGNEFKLVVAANVTNLKATGKYSLEGTAASIVPLKGDGDMSAEAEAVTMHISISLTNTDLFKANIDVSDVKYDIGSIKVDLENLEGGGDLGRVLNKILNLLGQKIFDYVEPSISHVVEDALQNLINDELKSKIHQSQIWLHLPLIQMIALFIKPCIDPPMTLRLNQFQAI